MKITGRLAVFLPLLFFPLAACHEIGHVDGPGGYGSTGSDLVGEIQYVDTRDRQIELRTEGGRVWSVMYDRQTRVTYRQRDYEVANLEPGDFVAMRTTQDNRGRLYTDLITVRESVQDRGSYSRRDGELRGVVQRNDPRYSSIQIYTDDRRQVAFFHDQRTLVRYRNRDYPVMSVAPGDYVIVRTRDSTQATPTASRITVTAKAGESNRSIDRLQIFEGWVEYVDPRRGTLEIRDRQNRIVHVTLAYNAPRIVSDRLSRLRRGDYVRIEGRFTADNRFELEAFV